VPSYAAPKSEGATLAKPAPAVPVKPVAPPFPYRIAGKVVQEDGMRVVLSKGSRIFEVREGETLEDGYRLQSIAPHALRFVYEPLAVIREVAVAGLGLDMDSPLKTAKAAQTSSPDPVRPALKSAAGAAHIRFDGPPKVNAGKSFEVALKVTSTQPLRAMPMQLTYDATRLEPVAVRAGDLFADGRFAYRVNPGGSIFVGASGTGRVAADAELCVITFRPIASGDAELKVSSLLVQDSAGRTIAHPPPQSFRAAIHSVPDP
jgi:hypothetical protein